MYHEPSMKCGVHVQVGGSWKIILFCIFKLASAYYNTCMEAILSSSVSEQNQQGPGLFKISVEPCSKWILAVLVTWHIGPRSSKSRWEDDKLKTHTWWDSGCLTGPLKLVNLSSKLTEDRENTSGFQTQWNGLQMLAGKMWVSCEANGMPRTKSQKRYGDSLW